MLYVARATFCEAQREEPHYGSIHKPIHGRVGNAAEPIIRGHSIHRTKKFAPVLTSAGKALQQRGSLAAGAGARRTLGDYSIGRGGSLQAGYVGQAPCDFAAGARKRFRRRFIFAPRTPKPRHRDGPGMCFGLVDTRNWLAQSMPKGMWEP